MNECELTVQALVQTYSCGCETSNVREAEAFLSRRMEDSAFLFQLLDVIETSINASARISACVLLKDGMRRHWHVDMESEAKHEFLARYFVILDKTGTLGNVFTHTTRVLVCLLKFTSEWELFASFFVTGFHEHVMGSLITLEAFTSTLKMEPSENVIRLGQEALPFLVHVMTAVSDLQSLTLIFQTLYNLSKYGCVCFPAEILSVCLSLMTRLSNSCDGWEFSLSRAVLRFYAHTLRHQPSLVITDQALELLKVFKELVEAGSPVCLRPYQANIFHAFLEYPPTREAIANSLPDFCQRVILPFFILTPEDVEDSFVNPKSFLASFHAQLLSYADYRGCICGVVSRSQLAPAIGAFFGSLLRPDLPDPLIYSILHIMSSCIDISSIDPFLVLLQSNSHLVRCGTLLCVRQFPCDAYPVEFYVSLIGLLCDQSILVQYFSLISLDILWQKETRQEETVRACTPYLTVVLENYMRLAEEFCDFDFVNFIAKFLCFFSPALVDISRALIPKVFEIYLHFLGCSEDPCSPGVILTEFFLFIRFALSSKADICSTLDSLILMIIESLPHVPNAVRGSLLILISNIICMTPIYLQSCEQIISHSLILLQLCTSNESTEAFLVLLRNVVVKCHTHVNCSSLFNFALETLSTLLKSWEKTGSIYASFHLISALIDSNIPPDPSPVFSILIDMITPFFEFQDAWCSISSLLLAMFTHGLPISSPLFSRFLEMSSSKQLRCVQDLFPEITNESLAQIISEKEEAETSFNYIEDLEDRDAVIPIMYA